MGAIVIIVVVILAILGIIAYLRFRQSLAEKKRCEALPNVAEYLKLNFSFVDKFDILLTIYDHSIFKEVEADVDECEVSNIIYGSYKGKTLHCFDYHFVKISYDKNGRETYERNYYFSCVLYDFGNKVYMKRLLIRPKGFGDKILSAMGINVINFESDEFNKKFHVKSEDKKFAYDVIHPRVMDLFLRHKIFHSFELSEHSILLCNVGKLQPHEVQNMLDIMAGFVNLMPEYLLQELKDG